MHVLAGKYSLVAMVEEEQCEELLLLMKLLSHLSSKNNLNFGPVEAASPGEVEAVDVVISGLSTILPLMTEETLKVSQCSGVVVRWSLLSALTTTSLKHNYNHHYHYYCYYPLQFCLDYHLRTP